MEILSENNNQEYQIAQRKVQKIKRFYTHLIVYLIVNTFIIAQNIKNLDAGESVFKFSIFSATFFWGIGLLVHALNVFSFSLFFNEKWEEKKINEFMEKDKKQSQSWN